MINIQMRGHCQACGRRHACTNGVVAKHGYTVDYGYFNGVCGGSDRVPMEASLELTNKIVGQMRASALAAAAYADKIEGGWRPETIAIEHFRKQSEQVAYADVPEWQQVEWARSQVGKARHKARVLDMGAAELALLGGKFHGMPLQEVAKPPKPDQIKIGERRISKGGKVMAADSVQGGRVYWRNDRGLKFWVGAAAWRRLPLAD